MRWQESLLCSCFKLQFHIVSFRPRSTDAKKYYLPSVVVSISLVCLGSMTMSTAREKTEVESSSLLDTDIETDIWALGITEKSISAEVVGNPYNPREFERVHPSIGAEQHALDVEVTDSPRKQFDFIHIRYQSTAGMCDGARMFRLAFEQTKPGGWIEVVENGPTSSSRICSASIADENEKAISRTPSNIVTSSTFGNSNIACWIKQQLIDAGFVEVEEKVWKVASKPWQRTITGIGRFIVAFLSMRWVWDDTGTIYQEKGPEKHYEPSVFVIARRP